MSIEETNNAQANNLATLREKIEARRKEFSESLPKTPDLELIEVPAVRERKTVGEFDLERHEDLCHKINILYHNYLYYTFKLHGLFDREHTHEELKVAQENYKESLKLLTKNCEELLSEGLLPRFS